MASHSAAMEPETHRLLSEAERLKEKGQTSEALKWMDKAAQNPRDRGVVLHHRGYLHLGRGDHAAAMEDFLMIQKLATLDEKAMQSVRYTLAQLLMEAGRHEQALGTLEAWFRLEAEPRGEAYALLAGIHLLMGKHGKAVEPLRKAIALSPTPRENWYQSLLAAYFELKEHGHCEELLGTMLRLFPQNKDYWRQLAALLMNRGKNREALAVMEGAYLGGHLVMDRDLVTLAQLHMEQGAPFKGALLLEEEIRRGRIPESGENLLLATDGWSLAREWKRARLSLEKVWKISHRPEHGLRLARLCLEEGEWRKGEEILTTLLKSGSVPKAGQVWLLLGYARHQSGEKAEEAFQQASKDPETEQEAKEWLNFLASREI